MLFQTIQNKSTELEVLLLAGQAKKEDVESFIDLLAEAIPRLYSIDNYGAALVLLTKWETLFYDYFNIVKRIKNTYIYNHRELSAELINEQLLSVSDFSNIVPSLFLNKESLDVFEGSKEIFEGSNVDTTAFPDEQVLTVDTQNTLDLIAFINHAFKKSDLESAIKVCDRMIEEFSEGVIKDSNELFYFSWTLHSRGNIACVLENYTLAHEYYSFAVDLKERHLKMKEDNPGRDYGFLLYSLYMSKMKYLSVSLSQESPKIVVEGLEKLSEEIESSKHLMDAVNKKYYLTLKSNLYYHMAKANIYNKKITEGINYLRKNMKMSLENNDTSSYVRAMVYTCIYRDDLSQEDQLKKIEKTLDSLDAKYRVHPIVRALIGEKHILEYSFGVFNKGFGEKVRKVFSGEEIFPLNKVHSAEQLAMV